VQVWCVVAGCCAHMAKEGQHQVVVVGGQGAGSSLCKLVLCVSSCS
jgi:hypothetical protein